MRIRLVIALIVLFGVTAFAPAPLPRRDRAVVLDGLSLRHLAGTWRVVSLHTTTGNGGTRDAGRYLATVRVDNDRWTFSYIDPQKPTVPYTITLDPAKSPAPIDFFQGNPAGGQPYGSGIIRRKGDQLVVIYNWGATRPTSFENPPTGYWYLTLQRER